MERWKVPPRRSDSRDEMQRLDVRGGCRGWGGNQCRKPREWEKKLVGRCGMFRWSDPLDLPVQLARALPAREGPGGGSAPFSSPLPSLGLRRATRVTPGLPGSSLDQPPEKRQ